MCRKTLSKLLQETKKLSIPRRNLISREECEKAIAETQRKYKDSVFEINTRICKACLKELRERTGDHIYRESLKEKQVCHNVTHSVEDDGVLIGFLIDNTR